jgi:Mg-chelatase subunit ChlD
MTDAVELVKKTIQSVEDTFGSEIFLDERTACIRLPIKSVSDIKKFDIMRASQVIRTNYFEYLESLTSIILIAKDNFVEMDKLTFFMLQEPKNLNSFIRIITESKEPPLSTEDPNYRRMLDMVTIAAGKKMMGVKVVGNVVQMAAGRGRVIGYKKAKGTPRDVAILPTVVQAYMNQRPVYWTPQGKVIMLERSDFMEKVRKTDLPVLVAIVFNLGGYTEEEKKHKITIPAIVGILNACYQRRDHTALISYAGSGSEILLEYSSDVEQASRIVKSQKESAMKPLASGILTAMKLLKARAGDRGNMIPIMAIIMDGKPDTPLYPGGNIDRGCKESQKH